MAALGTNKNYLLTADERRYGRHGVTQCGENQYSLYPLAELCRLIAFSSDLAAIREFHDNRPVFRHGEKQMLLGSFLDRLRVSAQAYDWSSQKRAVEAAARAYDLTLDKFLNLPLSQMNDGPDCRLYFSAFLKKYEAWREANPSKGEIEAEYKAATLLQKLVLRHFRLSLKEARRDLNPFWSRYRWQVNGKSINLMLPKSLEGTERRAWLEKNVSHPDPRRPGEQRRIQEIIDTQLSGVRFVSLTEALDRQTASPLETEWEYEYDLSMTLAANVAREKAENIDDQRPAIRDLGATALQEMILTIFKQLAEENYRQTEIAEKFGVSTGTISRFAGQEWASKNKTDSVPDLWANTAKVVAKNSMFRDFARQAGITETINRVKGAAGSDGGKEVRLG